MKSSYLLALWMRQNGSTTIISRPTYKQASPSRFERSHAIPPSARYRAGGTAMLQHLEQCIHTHTRLHSYSWPRRRAGGVGYPRPRRMARRLVFIDQLFPQGYIHINAHARPPSSLGASLSVHVILSIADGSKSSPSCFT